jgi:hypothetical protein
MHAADKLADLILASAQTVADLSNKDPRTVKRNEQPFAYLQTPHGQKALYQLTQDLLDAAELNSKD